MRALTKEWLRQGGYQVRCVSEGGLVPRGGFDVIVCSAVDLRGRGVEQLELVSLRHPGVPIVALSGQQRRSLACSSDRTGALGASAVLAKPFTQAELLAAVAAALRSGG